MALTERDLAIIELERTWWSLGASKETLIKERFDLSTSRYYDILADIVESDEALTFDPMVIRRLRKLRANRRRARFEGQMQRPPAR